MTSAERITRAQGQEALARQTPSEICRTVNTENAGSWWRLTTIAKRQEAWARGDW